MPRGGYREGAGRPPGAANKAHAELKNSFRFQALVHAERALSVLLDVAENGTSDAARVSAANAILERAMGRVAPEPLLPTEESEQDQLMLRVHEAIRNGEMGSMG